MSARIHNALNALLSQKLNLSQSNISQGSQSQIHIRELLDNKWKSDPHFPWLTTGDFLSGSYARGTKIRPLDDIDIFVILDGEGLFAWENGVRLDAAVRGDGYKGSPVVKFIDPDGMISSKMILEVFRDAIRESYPNSEIKKDNQAVNVWLDSYGLGLDIVPAFHIVPTDGSSSFYFIPVGKNSSRWMRANPHLDQERSESLDRRHNSNMKPIIKLLKHWNSSHNNDLLRPYHLEVLAWEVFDSHPGLSGNHYEGLVQFFSNSGNLLRNSMPDRVRPGSYIDEYLTPTNRNQSIIKMQHAGETLRNSANTILFDPGRAERQLQEVLGNEFKL